MSDHYYTNNPQKESNPFHFQTTINSYNLNFQTDDGVFSKKQIDYGTRVLLEHFDPPEINGDLLDVGCGYGPIGIVLAKRFENHKVVMVDINERAVHLSNQNIAMNKVNNAFAYVSDGLSRVKQEGFASIVTNPPFRAGKDVVINMIEGSHVKLQKGGDFWLVAQKKQGAPSLKKKMEEVFGNAEVIKRDKGYYVLKSKKID
ncbi:class I SAM-dependent methyltransferase [Alkalibacillus haloalkaliphilus]|uniref:class I SAM-dependent methyltransferase n=1 Tax=Alkalibacillus haloalkaliphilus TaxID=94136 RepID=UPI0029362C5B|nr:class I SAM-dependent methyltransferase [Alkalibacillus haloalkaliphilus]MDV2582680.1 class I SAM-dependent methyltransferase [Alkalibacillus haloalkaliphilus]